MAKEFKVSYWVDGFSFDSWKHKYSSVFSRVKRGFEWQIISSQALPGDSWRELILETEASPWWLLPSFCSAWRLSKGINSHCLEGRLHHPYISQQQWWPSPKHLKTAGATCSAVLSCRGALEGPVERVLVFGQWCEQQLWDLSTVLHCKRQSVMDSLPVGVPWDRQRGALCSWGQQGPWRILSYTSKLGILLCLVGTGPPHG